MRSKSDRRSRNPQPIAGVGLSRLATIGDRAVGPERPRYSRSIAPESMSIAITDAPVVNATCEYSPVLQPRSTTRDTRAAVSVLSTNAFFDARSFSVYVWKVSYLDHSPVGDG